ncbi:MAG: hypothetical protein CL797_10405 [Chromatiales bacterium]|jgi:hypothetical protein|nr:hypothetical protein [Chromatiales bacterium]
MALLLILFVGLYVTNFRNINSEVFSAAAAWTRACIFFCLCFLVSWLTGTQAMILAAPIATQPQMQDLNWIAWTIGLTALIFIVYWGIWARYTIRFNRKLHLATQIPFGLLWGASMGQLFLVIWNGINSIGSTWPQWLIVVMTWVSLGACFWAWMVFYWDLYVAPEHDSKYSIALKTVTVHLPQSLLCITYLTIYNNFIILIGLQTLALVGASIFMRMPPFWSTKPTPAARPHPFLFGLVYAGGYVSSAPKNDPYLKAAHLPY